MAVGKSVTRVDAYEKVTGRAMFTEDLIGRQCYTAKVLHAKIGNGRVKKIDVSRAEALPGVIKVVTFQDVPKHAYPTPGHPWSVEAAHQDVADRRLLTDRIRYYGDDIAAVVAEDEVTAARAIRLIEVEYEEYPVVTDPFLSMKGEGIPIHEEKPDNVLAKSEYELGNVEEKMGQADIVIEGIYETAPVQHCHLENPISYAYMEKNRVVVVSSTQIPHIVRRVIGQALGIEWGRVRVIKPYIGGGFGNKQDVLYEPLNAFLTMQVGGRPVKLEIAREETFVNTRTRHEIFYDLKMGMTREGRIIAKEMEACSNQGGYASHGHAIVANGATAWRHLYDVKDVKAKACTVYTNCPVGGAMRGYGIPQVCFAVESFMDDAAKKIGMDPILFRQKNIYKGFFQDPYLKEIAANTNGVAECMEKGAEWIGWKEKRERYQNQTGNIRRGVGMAIFSYKTGVWPISLEISGARMILNQDGSVQLMLGATEIGQGADTVFSQMTAQTLGMEMDKIHIMSTQDTDVSPFDTGAYASRQTYVTGEAVKQCALLLKKKILDYSVKLLIRREQIPEEEGWQEKLDFREGKVWLLERPLLTIEEIGLESYYSLQESSVITAEVSLQKKQNAIAFGATFAEVEVDVSLGKVKVLNIINVHDSGKIINPQLATMQVHGGMSMGIGYGLSEELKIDSKTGRVLNGTLLDYKLPTMMDSPDLKADFVETYDPTGPYGNKALGEPPAISPAPAIRNAVLHATGVSINRLPLSPQRLIDEFTKAGLLKGGFKHV
ncbi:MAG: xanthine dehydrogenase molybdenum-binding subunit XdhA [Lachnospiraceae bacterium]|nr:xanthine dehydrogenase molybdenum-binding subunit XdhA [Lachnospiraceae bacterium]